MPALKNMRLEETISVIYTDNPKPIKGYIKKVGLRYLYYLPIKQYRKLEREGVLTDELLDELQGEKILCKDVHTVTVLRNFKKPSPDQSVPDTPVLQEETV